jgi:NAD(P)H-dependent FMN reductase
MPEGTIIKAKYKEYIMSKKITVILGSVRTGRAGKAVADWFMDQTAEFNSDLEFDFIDLKELDLPFMDEPVSPMMSNNYQHEHTRNWSRIIGASDGFVFIIPEYNHGYSPVLKNAIDFLFNEWKGKPVGLVGYGGSGARASIRQLREILDFIGMKSLDNQLGIMRIWEAVDENGKVKSENVDGDPSVLLADLAATLSPVPVGV